MERGFVKLWRKTLDSGLLQNGPAFQVFGYLLLKASHKQHRQIVGGQIVDLNPGDVICGRIKIAADLKLGEQQVRTALQLLKNLEILTSRATNKFTVFSFVNWDRYQDEQPTNNQQNNQPATIKQPAANQQLTTNKNERMKEYKKKTDASHLAQSDADASSGLVSVETPEPVCMKIPLADGTDYGVPSSLVGEFSAAYPGVDVVGQLAKARAWCLSNPEKRKTVRGVRRFLNSWLDRAQNNASRASPIAMPMTAKQAEARDRGAWAEQILQFDEAVRHGNSENHSVGTEQSVRPLPPATPGSGGIRAPGQDVV